MAKPFIVIDTETSPIVPSDEIIYANMRVYDIAWIITDGNTIFESRSFIVADTFFNNSLMNNAYYAEKLPRYYEGMGKEWIAAKWFDIWKQFNADIKNYGIRDIWAYNIKFDRAVCNATICAYSNEYVRYFFPYKVRYHDIWDYAGSTICATKKYVKWCQDNSFFTASGNPLTNAETVYRYLFKDKAFQESHTALKDCEIELQILNKAKRQHKKAANSIGQGWRQAARIMKESSH